MKIYTNSWHYRFVYGALTNHFLSNLAYPKNFCHYIRQLCKVSLFYLLSLATITGAFYNVYNIIFYGVMSNWPDPTEGLHWVIMVLYAAWVFVGMLGTAVVVAGCSLFVVGGVGYGIASGYEHGIKPLFNQPNKTKEPSLFSQAYQAYKDKFCPVIEIVAKEE